MEPDTECSAADQVGGRQWRLILAFWTSAGLLESTKAWVTLELRGTGGSFVHALVGNMPWWAFWAVVTPFAFGVARRFPLAGPHRWRHVAVHVSVAAVAAALHVVTVGGLYYLTHARGRVPSYGWLVRSWTGNFLMLHLLTYGAIVGAWHALAYHGRYRASRLEAARLAAEAARMEAAMTEARLDALRMELNPHFLFNALNAISGLVRRRENQRAVHMLARLGELLRRTLDGEGAHRVPLHEELALLGHYLDLERVRFHDRLQVEVEVDAEARCALVPSLILQPLVENAVRHGIARKPGEGAIRITARRDGERLRIEVHDTGVGLTVAEAGRGPGVGLSNTRARLAQMYGDAAGLDLRDNDEGGATALLDLPLEAAAERRVRAVGGRA